uniref:Uncharacterized protein n=1 Tax=Anguilla anguilla TaxID=7936 RepID=A0A0E9PFT2_ANGAN
MVVKGDASVFSSSLLKLICRAMRLSHGTALLIFLHWPVSNSKNWC